MDTIKLLIAGRQGLFYVVIAHSEDIGFGVSKLKQIHPAPCWGMTATAKDQLVVASRKVGFDDIQEVPTRFVSFDTELLPTDYVEYPSLKDCHQIAAFGFPETKLLATSCATNELVRMELDSRGGIHSKMPEMRIGMDGERGWDIGHWNNFHIDRNGRTIACRHGYGKPSFVYAWEFDQHIGNKISGIENPVGLHAHNIVPWLKDTYFTFSSKTSEVYCYEAWTPNSSRVVHQSPVSCYYRGAAMIPRFFGAKDSLFIAGGTANVEKRADRGSAKSWLEFYHMGMCAYEDNKDGKLSGLPQPHVVELDIGPVHELFLLDRFDLCRPDNLFIPALNPGFHL